MKFYICNAFSLSMLDREQQAGRDSLDGVRTPRPVELPAVMDWISLMKKGKVEWESAVGHTDTAALFTAILGIEITPARVSINLKDQDVHCLIGQYIGPRLPEGAIELPESARIEWWTI